MRSLNTTGFGFGVPTYIIAEMGINHNGDLAVALRMVEEAKHAGADAVKIQIVHAARSYAATSPSFAIFKKVELPDDAWATVVAHARKIGIEIFASFGQPDDIRYLTMFDFPAVKISSSNITNFPLLKAVAGTGRHVIVSSGMSTLGEVDEAITYLEECGATSMSILHCTALYPTQPHDANLRVITTLTQAFPYPIGYSDHTEGTLCSTMAVTLGARILEKHFTLDRGMAGPDHHFSATVDELARLVREVRAVEAALGSSRKQPVAAERAARAGLRRTVVAARTIAAGERLSADNMTVKRSPVAGIEPRMFDQLIGKTASRTIAPDEPIPFVTL